MQDLAVWRNTISQEGIRAALCWHKVAYLFARIFQALFHRNSIQALVTGLNADDDKRMLNYQYHTPG